ncbi:DinB family protein [bacterium]|nr:DinB family protein [bacterium]
MDTPQQAPPARLLALNAAALRHLLQGADEHLPPARLLEGLSPEQACAVAPGMPHSIATLLGHMTHWQEHACGWLAGELPPAAPIPDEINFPAVQPEQWEALRQSFLDSLEQLCQLLEQQGDAELPAGEVFYKGRSSGFLMAMQALHNTYHLGQIVLLRRMLGAWPEE